MLTLVIQEMIKEFPTLMETLVCERDQLVIFCFLYSVLSIFILFRWYSESKTKMLCL